MKELPANICDAYDIHGAAIEPLGTGLINRTWLVRAANGTQFVLQKVNALFPPQLNLDIDAVTRHLAGKGIKTPLLMKTVSGDLCLKDDDAVWRMYDYVDGIVYDKLTGSEQAREAGKLLAQFHVAIDDLDYEFTNARPGVHDTPAHLNRMTTALVNHRDSEHYSDAKRLADEILDSADGLLLLDDHRDRNVHGDPKISNLMFDRNSGEGLCLLDFDTLTRMPLPLEMGDAFRSWCNTAGEDTANATFSLELFEAAIRGYASVTRSWINESEWRAFVTATETIYMELASRFCADALNQSYFDWNPEKFSTRFEHNMVRALGQLNAARSLAACKAQAEQIVIEAFTQ